MMSRNFKKTNVLTLAVLTFILSTAVVIASTESEKLLTAYRNARNDSERVAKLSGYLDLEITERLGMINSVEAQVPSDARMVNQDKLVVNTLLSDARTRMGVVQGLVDQADSVDELRSATTELFTNSRIYKVVMPKVYAWKTISRADFVTRYSIDIHFEKLDQAVAYLKYKGEETKDLENRIKNAKDLSEEVKYRVRLAKESFDKMEPGKDQSAERSLLEGGLAEITKIKELLADLKFEMRQISSDLEPRLK